MILDRITGYYRINKLVIVNNKNELETPLLGRDFLGGINLTVVANREV